MNRKLNVTVIMLVVISMVFGMTALADSVHSNSVRIHTSTRQTAEAPEADMQEAAVEESDQTVTEVEETEENSEESAEESAEEEREMGVNVTSSIPFGSQVATGTVAHFHAEVYGLEGYTYTIQWQISDGGAYTDVPGATGEDYSVTITEENAHCTWRVAVNIDEPQE